MSARCKARSVDPKAGTVLLEPQFDAFASRYDRGAAQLVFTTLLADLTTPVAAMLKLGARAQNSVLLESIGVAEGAAVRGRYSVLGLRPDLIWRCRGAKAEINTNALYEPQGFSPCKEDTLASLRSLVATSHIDLPPELPPVAAGLFGYLAYDTVRQVERLPGGKPDPLGLPDGLFVRPSVAIVFDIVRDVMIIVTPVRPRRGTDATTAYAQARERLAETVAGLDRPLPDDVAAPPQGVLPAPVSNTTKAHYLAMVEAAQHYIRAGDIFQVVPSQRFRLPFALPPAMLYRALRRTNPSPYMFFLDFEDFALVGSSPETLVRLQDGKVTIRPIAGTYPRGATAEEDKASQKKLLADPKERAEHMMLLDLGRNDVGRVARIGSVEVKEAFALQLLSKVMHIVSTVEGEIAEGQDAVSALLAGFPAGTVSGAPKVRAMEIIDELEPEKRGPYAGAVGYFSAGGSMDTCIALRTAILKDGMMYVQAGGGVVADSVPESEYQETVNKSCAVLLAAEEALRAAAEGKRGQ